jgi:small-conductance mechanosensitive channel
VRLRRDEARITPEARLLLPDALRRVSDALRRLLGGRRLDTLRLAPEILLLDVLRLLPDDLTGMVSPFAASFAAYTSLFELRSSAARQAWARIRCTNSLNR